MDAAQHEGSTAGGAPGGGAPRPAEPTREEMQIIEMEATSDDGTHSNSSRHSRGVNVKQAEGMFNDLDNRLAGESK